MSKLKFYSLLLIASVFILFIIAFVLGSTPKSNLEIITASPADKSTNVSTYPSLYVVFSRPLSDAEKQDVAIISSPDIDSFIYWGKDNKSLNIDLNSPLSPSTDYTLTIKYLGGGFSWTFKTTSASSTQQDFLIQQQGQYDKAYIQAQQKFLNKYPWYNNLPPANNDYFIDFNVGTNTFIVELYPKNSSSAPVAQQIPQLENEVVHELQTLGVNTASYKFNWVVVPQ